jgi:hypothetical protein
LDPFASTQRQVKQHLAGRNRHQEQLFWIVLVRFAEERRIGRADQIGLSGDDHPVLSAVGSVAGSTPSEDFLPRLLVSRSHALA